jgi:hypothetical protein
MTKWWHNGPVGGITVPVYSGNGAVLHAATQDSADKFVRVLNGLEKRVDLLEKSLNQERCLAMQRVSEESGL